MLYDGYNYNFHKEKQQIHLFVHFHQSFFFFFPGLALLCECDEFCPDNHFNNYTCATNEGYCFAKLHYDIKNKTTVRTHGCTADTHDGGIFQCRHKKHEKPTVMMCCKDADYCNSNLKPTMKIVTDHELHQNGMFNQLFLFMHFLYNWYQSFIIYL